MAGSLQESTSRFGNISFAWTALASEAPPQKIETAELDKCLQLQILPEEGLAKSIVQLTSLTRAGGTSRFQNKAPFQNRSPILNCKSVNLVEIVGRMFSV